MGLSAMGSSAAGQRGAMSPLAHARSHKDLVVYQKASSVQQQIFEITKTFPKEETYSLTDQLRRSSRSIGAQIAEGWAKRRYEKHFASKLTDADAEQHETRHWVDTAKACGYVDERVAADLTAKLAEIGRMLNGIIQKAPLFCRGSAGHVSESLAVYFATDE